MTLNSYIFHKGIWWILGNLNILMMSFYWSIEWAEKGKEEQTTGWGGKGEDVMEDAERQVMIPPWSKLLPHFTIAF